MGPLATHDFYRKVIECTPAADDPQHIPVVMVADTQIPLRIPAWEGRGPSPLPALIKAAQQCVGAGATVLAMPCNTAHFWFEELVAALPRNVQFLHIADETVRCLPQALPQEMSPGMSQARRIALAGTHVTLAMKLYQQAAQRLGMNADWLLPSEDEQALITAVIADVKAGCIDQAVAHFNSAVQALEQRGAEAVILGCTELPVIAQSVASRVRLIDATDCLARACVQACKP
jgi:aspartate racemase